MWLANSARSSLERISLHWQKAACINKFDFCRSKALRFRSNAGITDTCDAAEDWRRNATKEHWATGERLSWGEIQGGLNRRVKHVDFSRVLIGWQLPPATCFEHIAGLVVIRVDSSFHTTIWLWYRGSVQETMKALSAPLRSLHGTDHRSVDYRWKPCPWKWKTIPIGYCDTYRERMMTVQNVNIKVRTHGCTIKLKYITMISLSFQHCVKFPRQNHLMEYCIFIQQP